MSIKEEITFVDFEKIDIRVGTIISAERNTKAKKPAYILQIDFGHEIGTRKTSAQITSLYQTEELLNKQIVAVVNFPPKQIANMISECLILGAVNGEEVTLLNTDKPVENGLKVS